jgi:hypothetical protein
VKRRLGRWFERFVLGVLMGVVARVLERRLRRARR